MDIQISIIIVNFNTAELLSDCIQSVLADTSNPTYEIIVVDNNSSDHSLQMLRNSFPNLIVVENTTNKGYAVANNQGLKIASGKYVWLLNPDTIVFRNCMKILHDYLESDSNAGAVSPRTWLDVNKTLEVCSLKLLTPERAKAFFTRLPSFQRNSILKKIWDLDSELWTSTQPVIVEGIGGAAFFTSRKLLNEIGNLDERFFMGYEDTDLSSSIKNRNLNIYIHPNAEIVHLFGQAKQLPEAPQKAVYAWQTAPLSYIDKHYGQKAAAKFKKQRLIDSLWRRMIPSPRKGSESITNKNGVTLTWPDSDKSRYIVEISNDRTFYDKFGREVHGNNLKISNTLLNRLKNEMWFWRVWSSETGSNKYLISQGFWHWKK
ncbi:glycosyltransferase family 2 protein [bacterium]|nr:glycosyltransferase family 2 protein [bacterium]